MIKTSAIFYGSTNMLNDISWKLENLEGLTEYITTIDGQFLYATFYTREEITPFLQAYNTCLDGASWYNSETNELCEFDPVFGPRRVTDATTKEIAEWNDSF